MRVINLKGEEKEASISRLEYIHFFVHLESLYHSKDHLKITSKSISIDFINFNGHLKDISTLKLSDLRLSA